MTKIDGAAAPMRMVETGSAAAAQSARAGATRSAPVAATPEADSLRLTGEATGLQTLARDLGAAPAGIDMDRVNAVRASIADGSYRIDSQAIANRMLDLERALS
ncbi:flagellar biosynthesis anti-sigma factor FlgM [Lysobacter bugurensis]|uniref:Negative regulator of flagellin synthesis n=1 Tax=Cognatilysobacter bugurensis TaxID=543356 RepID=A0A918WAG3_9GAMM|nr:flagellar biosynthesis anti-sigma factor FlgM [Lysobacter bugurensis]